MSDQVQPQEKLAQSPLPISTSTVSRALTRRSLPLGLFVSLLWIVTISWSTPNEGVLQQQLMLLTGFGAILTLFFVKFLADFLPVHKRLTAAELTFVFAMTLTAIPTSIMGRMALESAITNHFLDAVDSGKHGWIPDFWAPNPHLGLIPRLDPPDARCPYLALPPHDDGSARRSALAPPLLAESEKQIDAAVAATAQHLKEAREAAGAFANSRDVLDTTREVETAAATAEGAQKEIRGTPAPDAARAAYLAWAAVEAAKLSARGAACIRNANAVNNFRKGKARVEWSLWAVPLVYWFVVMLSFCCVLLFALMALRESWIERERLPFPLAQIAHGTVAPVPVESSPAGKTTAIQESFPSAALTVAFLIGFLFCVRGMVSISDTGGAGTVPNHALIDIDLSGLNLVKGVAMHLTVLPFALLCLLFFPLDMLWTVASAYIVAAFGVPFLLDIVGVSERIDVRYTVLWMGGTLGITVFILIFHFRDLARLITGLWQRSTVGRTSGTEPPLSPRELSVGFMLTFTVFCFFIIAGEGDTGKPLLTQILMLVYVLAMVTIYNLPYMRVRASGGFGAFEFNNILHVGGWFNWNWWKQIHTVPLATGSRIMEPDSPLSYHSIYQLETFGAYTQAIGPSTQLLDAFALAERTRASLRDIFKGVLLATILALLVGMPLYLIAVHHIGYDNTPSAGSWGNYCLTTDKAARYYTKVYPGIFSGNTPYWVIGGALLIGTCMYLRREYARFPIEPLGLFIAGYNGGRTCMGSDTIWFTFVVALGLKWIIFRWYGVRVFQEKVLPLAVYGLMGMSLGVVLYLFLSAAILSKGIAF